MADVLVGSIYKHRTYCFSGNQVGINTRYFSVAAGTGPNLSEAAFIVVLDGILAPLYKLALTNLAQYVGSNIQNITGAIPYPAAVGTSANSGNGTAGTLPVPSQVSGLISIRTGLTGRSYRGRQYIPFPDSSESTGTTPPVYTGAYQTRLLNIAAQTVGTTTVTSGASSYQIQWGLVHQKPVAIAGSFTPSTTALVGISWATQKRRGDYGRTNPSPTP